jgi:DNA-binding NarL/FixJ family response regulator
MTINLIDNHVLLTQVMKRLLLSQSDITEVKEYENGEAFLNDTNSLPDIIITDIQLSGVNGIKLLEQSWQKHKGKTRTIVLSAIDDIPTIRQCIYYGADAYLSKTSSTDELLQAIREVTAGNKYIGRSLRDGLLNSVNAGRRVITNLSSRENDVLQKVCSGYTIKEIASELKLSKHTVRYYYRNLLGKLSIKRTSDLIIFAIQNGLFISAAIH